MENKRMIKKFSVGVAIVVIITLLLSIFYNSAFIPAFMLMGALLVFSICYYMQENKKSLTYFLFVIGVLLVIGSLVYTYVRLA